MAVDEELHPYQRAEHVMSWFDRIDWYLRTHDEPLKLGMHVKVQV